MGAQETVRPVVRIDIPGSVTIHSPTGVLVIRASLDHPLISTLTTALDPETDAFRHLAQTVVENGFDVPPIACVTHDSTGWRIFLMGDMAASVGGTDPQSLTGSGRSTWVEQNLPPNASVLIESAGAAPSQAITVPDSTVHVATGMPNLGAALSPGESAAPPPAPPVTPAHAHDDVQPPPPTRNIPSVPDPNVIGSENHRHAGAPAASSIIDAAEASATSEPAAPQQNTSPPTDVEATLDAEHFRDQLPKDPEPSGNSTAPLVTAKVCPCGSANPLTTGECRTCGSSLRREGVNIEQAPRPPLGFLVFDDGSRHELTSSVVIGRAAPSDHLIEDQPAEPITVTSPSKHVSKVHLEVRTIDWTVNIVDLDSANGTHVEGADGRAPRRLRPNVVEQISSGDLVKFGDRSFTFEATPGL